MLKRFPKIHIGLRTIKTTVAITLSMIIVDYLGTSASKLIFAMLGAMAAVQPTFKDSVDSCLAQIVGVLFGAFASIVLLMLPVPPLVATAIGMILVITLYNTLRIQYSPSLPCFIVVMMCTTPDIRPLAYAAERDRNELYNPDQIHPSALGSEIAAAGAIVLIAIVSAIVHKRRKAK